MNGYIYLSIALFGLAIMIGYIKAKQLENMIGIQREMLEEYKRVVNGNK